MALARFAAQLVLCLTALVGCGRQAVSHPEQASGGAGRETTMAQSPKDRASAAQAALDMEPLQTFFHPQEPGRKPLLILKNGQVADEPRLMKFGEPVRYVPPAEAKGKPHVEFTLLKVDNGSASVTLLYPVEGIEARAALRKQGGVWKVESQSIREK